MQQRNNTPLFIGAIVFGLLALGLTFFLLRGGGTPPPDQVAAGPTPTPKPTQQLVATRPIPPRTEITPDMVVLKDVQGAPVGAVTEMSALEGRLTNAEIRQGEPLALASFTDRVDRAVKANIEIPPGLRGVAVYVDPTQTAAGLVDVGDRVDVIATHQLSLEKGPRQIVVGAAAFTSGRTIAQDLLVLGVNKSIEAEPTPTPVPAGGVEGAPPPPPSTRPDSGAVAKTRVMLAATPAVAERLVAANAQGTLHLTIRRPTERDVEPSIPEAREYPSRLYTTPIERPASPAPMREVVRQPPQPRPRPNFGEKPGTTPAVFPTPLPPPPPDKEVTVIRGTEKTRVIVGQ